MKSNKLNVLTRFAIACLSTGLTAFAQDITDARLQQACLALQQSPLAAGEVQTLLDVSRFATNSPALRSRAMAAYSLTLLMQGNTNAFDRALHFLQTTCPESVPLLTVTRDDAYAPCDACAGGGVQTTLCPSCRGSGKCTSCGGSGKKADAACPACKGKRTCPLCRGAKRLEIPCPTCKGTQKVFKPSQKIRENFNTLLAGMSAICEENMRFSEQLRQASRETDTVKRIALLQKLLQTFPHRTDLGYAKTLFGEAVNTRDTQEALRLKQQAREQEERELNALRKLRDSDDLDGAIATVSAYLKGHAQTPARVELQALLDELIVKRNHNRLTRKILNGVLSLFGLLLLVCLIKPLLFKRKPEGTGPLPGMDKIDKAQFTDPLSLTSKESKARVKTKTAEIPPTEEV